MIRGCEQCAFALCAPRTLALGFSHRTVFAHVSSFMQTTIVLPNNFDIVCFWRRLHQLPHFAGDALGGGEAFGFAFGFGGDEQGLIGAEFDAACVFGDMVD